MPFLPDDYNIPSSNDKYMKLELGDNKFRILSEPIMGNEYWVEEDGKRKPIRKKMNEELVLSEIPEPDKIKHFWAMVVFDYADENIKVLEITQKGIMNSIKALSKDEDWGDPTGDKGYDFLIQREGEGLNTKYSVNPKPRKSLPDGVMELYKDMKIDLSQLYEGGDPFNPNAGKEEVDPKDIPF